MQRIRLEDCRSSLQKTIDQIADPCRKHHTQSVFDAFFTSSFSGMSPTRVEANSFAFYTRVDSVLWYLGCVVLFLCVSGTLPFWYAWACVGIVGVGSECLIAYLLLVSIECPMVNEEKKSVVVQVTWLTLLVQFVFTHLLPLVAEGEGPTERLRSNETDPRIRSILAFKALIVFWLDKACSQTSYNLQAERLVRLFITWPLSFLHLLGLRRDIERLRVLTSSSPSCDG